MNFKLLSLVLLCIVFVKGILLDLLDIKSASSPIKSNVRDVYDEEEYKRWSNYNSEKICIGWIDSLIDFLFIFAVLAFDALPFVASLNDNPYIQTIIIFLLFNLVNTVIKIPTTYISTIKIENKYGFNRSTNKTFLFDVIKGFILETALLTFLTCSFMFIHSIAGDWIIVVFSVVAVIAVILLSVIVPYVQKIYNKFRPLEEGSLRTRLTELLNKHGYRVRDIKVMDGSRRSSKANAYFSGMGKTKTIVLYDTIMDIMDEDELVAVFAHELAHGKHKHLPKNLLLNSGLLFIMILTVWGMLQLPICRDFGFSEVNHALIAILLFSVVAPFITLVYGLLTKYISRKHEYQADAFAAREGYGDALISGLKKLSKNNFSSLNPHPLIVALSYSHPPLSKRIAAIEKVKQNIE